MTSAASSVGIGGSVGGYRLERLLGRGETGTVYVAEGDGEQVALKIVDPEIAGSTRLRERFLFDCELLGSVDHPSVLPVNDAGESRGSLFVASRLVEGADLGAVLRDGPLSPEQAVSILEQVAGAVHAAHCSGLVHRDLKPSNVLLEAGTHRVFVTDFGLTGRTTDFASPERIEGKRLDGRADVYSLGALLAACLGGEECPELECVVAKARATDPEQRYTTALELAVAARRAVGSAPAPVAPPVVEEEPASEPASEPPAESPPRGERRRNLVVACAALLLVAGAAAGLVASLSGNGGQATISPPFSAHATRSVAGTVGAVGRTLSAVPAPPQPLYDVVANTGGVGVRYRTSPDSWCGALPQTDPCWRTVVPGTGAAEGQQLRVYCYSPGASVHGDTWWAKVNVDPVRYVPAAFLRSSAASTPPASQRC